MKHSCRPLTFTFFHISLIALTTTCFHPLPFQTHAKKWHPLNTSGVPLCTCINIQSYSCSPQCLASAKSCRQNGEDVWFKGPFSMCRSRDDLGSIKNDCLVPTNKRWPSLCVFCKPCDRALFRGSRPPQTRQSYKHGANFSGVNPTRNHLTIVNCDSS